jgi:hypothetical protein
MQADPCVAPDPCATVPPLQEPEDPIVLRIGDDWGLAFVYQDATGAAIDLSSGATIEGELYVPYTTAPLDLNAGNLRTAMIVPAEGSFALGLEQSVSSTLTPDNLGQPMSLLRIMAGKSGLVRTIGVFPLNIVAGNAPPIGLPTTLPVYTDPISQETVTLTGYSNAVPAPGV